MRQLIRQLQDTANRDRPGHRQHWRMKIRRGKQGKTNHADVEEGSNAGTEKRFQVLRIAPPATPAKSIKYREGDTQQLGG